VTARIPLFPLGTVLFPGRLLPLHIFEERYRLLVADLLERAGRDDEAVGFGVLAIRVGRETGVDGAHALHPIGTFAQLRALQAYDDGRFDLVAQGTRRFRLRSLVDDETAYLQAEVEWLPENVGEGARQRAHAVQARFDQYCAAIGLDASRDEPAPDDEGAGPPVAAASGLLSYRVAATMVLTPMDQQALLESPDDATRLRDESRLLRRELALFESLPSLPDLAAARVPIPLN
jgi:Lon protease-like protein